MAKLTPITQELQEIGRKSNTRQFIKRIRKEFEAIDQTTGQTRIDNLFTMLYHRSIKKQCYKSAELILNRLYGKPKENINFDVESNNELINNSVEDYDSKLDLLNRELKRLKES